jgi:uncharacterized membrane protein (UPF0182 family)
MVVNGGTNLAAYISADCDYGPDYGKLTVLQVNGSASIYGPSQVANDLKSTAVISKDISQLDQGQSTVLHGNLLTLPVGNSFLYVEPLYVQSTNGGDGAYPTLQRILVRFGNGDQLGYGSTLSSALDDIRLSRTTGSSLTLGQTTGNGTTGSGSGSPTPTPSPSTTPSSTSAPPGTSIAGLLAQLKTANNALNAAYNTHDPVQIAQAQAKVQQIVDELVTISVAPSATPSPTPTPKASATR